MMTWFTVESPTFRAIPQVYSDWLTRPSILTEAIARHYGQYEIDVLSHGVAPPELDEREYLAGHNESEMFVREVMILTPFGAFSYGRVIIPQAAFTHYEAEICGLGNRPIGETLLYNNPNVKRSEFEFGIVSPGSTLHQYATQKFTTPEVLYARRSKFFLGKPELTLSVTEVLHPGIHSYKGIIQDEA